MPWTVRREPRSVRQVPWLARQVPWFVHRTPWTTRRVPRAGRCSDAFAHAVDRGLGQQIADPDLHPQLVPDPHQHPRRDQGVTAAGEEVVVGPGCAVRQQLPPQPQHELLDTVTGRRVRGGRLTRLQERQQGRPVELARGRDRKLSDHLDP